ncbi:MAG TPA: HEAT repeat domain-containing protein [Polyangiaceae bacterium]|nr:HEAT repeat domain-containing protein [Polyangiaceae bacterium]
MLQKLAVIGLCWGTLAPTVAHAAPAAKPKVHSTLNLETQKKALESGDEARALAALDELELASEQRAAPLVEALLTRGANSKLLLRAIGVAGALGASSSSSALAPYVKHRAPEVRRAAARSLARTKGSVAVSALREALRGNDPALRSTAAEGLGALAAKDAVPDLFVVLPKEVPEAAGAIGVLCRADECKRFVGLLGKLPFEVMESGFLPLLLRTDAEAPDAAKLQLIEQLRRMATQKSSALLATALASYPANGSPKIRTAIDAALHGHPVTSTSTEP